MAELCITSAEMVDELENQLGYVSPTAAESANALKLLNMGLRRFLSGSYTTDEGRTETHAWSFLRPEATVTLWPDITGTMGCAGTTITATAAAFYDTVIGATLTADTSGNTYTITAYTSSTVITVDSDATTDDGDTFTVTATGKYCLPSDYGGKVGNPVYTEDDYANYDLIEESEGYIDTLFRDGTSSLHRYCITSKSAGASSAVQRYYMKLYPIPTAVRTIRLPYRKHIDALADDSNYPPGGADFCDAILLCGRAAVELDVSGAAGDMETRAMLALRRATDADTLLYDSTDNQETLD